MKLTGLILMLIGIALIVLKLAFNTILEKIPFLANLELLWIVVIGVVLIAVGFFISKSTKQASAEVPIYKSGKIIGYRRR